MTTRLVHDILRYRGVDDELQQEDQIEYRKYMYLLQAFNLLDRCAPDSAPKAVFTIGGPGAGKSYSIHLVLKDLEVNADSLIKIDPDDVLEKLFDNKNSVDTRRIHINPLTDKMYEVALRTKKSFISDGTGRNFAMISKRVAECKLQGFKTILVITLRLPLVE